MIEMHEVFYFKLFSSSTDSPSVLERIVVILLGINLTGSWASHCDLVSQDLWNTQEGHYAPMSITKRRILISFFSSAHFNILISFCFSILKKKKNWTYLLEKEICWRQLICNHNMPDISLIDNHSNLSVQQDNSYHCYSNGKCNMSHRKKQCNSYKASTVISVFLTGALLKTSLPLEHISKEGSNE